MTLPGTSGTQTMKCSSQQSRIVGFVNVPIVHFSVKWWRALHQPSTILGPEPSPIAAPIATALLVNWVAFTLLFVYFLARRIEIARLDDGAVDA